MPGTIDSFVPPLHTTAVNLTQVAQAEIHSRFYMIKPLNKLLVSLKDITAAAHYFFARQIALLMCSVLKAVNW